MTWNMDTKLTTTTLFEKVNLAAQGPVKWGTAIPDKSPGVYVVALSPDPNVVACEIEAEYLEPLERQRWMRNQPIVYIGQATSQTLTTRLSQFYRHKYGAKSPHRGGQALKLLKCDLWVYWAPCSEPRRCESIMLREFENCTGRLPFANRT